jgi:DNA-binding NtrC family response regulator
MQEDITSQAPLMILIIDDEPGVTKGMARLLRRDGHTVDTAENGRLALVQLQERRYDLLLCDLRMPELSGPDLYQIVMRHYPDLCQRMIFLTGDLLSPASQVFLEQHGLSCLFKPFHAAELRRAIHQVLRAG